MAKNISKVYLLSVPLEDDLKHTLYFNTQAKQRQYFENHYSVEYNNVSYQYEDRCFRCPDEINNIRNYNYIMWQNPAYSNKWFYGFITEFKKYNDNYTEVYFEIDPIQTYLFDYHVQPSFIEREHTNNDTPGNNTLPENVQLGEYVKNSTTGTPQIGPSTTWFGVGVSEIIGSLSKTPTSIINGLPNGLFYIFTDSVNILHSIARIYDDAGKANAIYTMFVFPKGILDVDGGYAYQSASWSYNYKGGSSTTFDVYTPTANTSVGKLISNYTISKPTRVGKTYQPRNRKLLTYPYCFFNISNNSGSVVEYHYEDFEGNPKFDMDGVLTTGCSTKLYPTNYKNMSIFSGDVQDNPYDYGITGGKYPTIAWNSDAYTNWLTQNGVNIALQAVNATTSLIAGGATASAVGGPMGTAMWINSLQSSGASVLSSIGEVERASHMPNQVSGNTNVGDLNYSAHKNKFTVFPLSIKPEYAMIIDDYFDVYGYATNRLKYPNVAHRENWWYIKTINVNITGNIPNDYINKIKEAYNNGLTFWRNPNNFLDYSVSNGIV